MVGQNLQSNHVNVCCKTTQVQTVALTLQKGIGAKPKPDRTSENAGETLKKTRVKNDVREWPRQTKLIIGDSIIGGIDEKKMQKHRVKVRSHGGAYVDDMYDFIAPLLRKKPDFIILHVGANDAQLGKSAKMIFDEISNLIAHIEHMLPEVKVFYSCPTLRIDNARANRVLRELDSKFKGSRFYCVMNDNLDGTCLGKHGLHINQKGSGLLARNYIKLIQSL